MDIDSEYYKELEHAIENRKSFIESDLLPQLSQHFQEFHSSYQSIYNVLMRKSLIEEDPYKYEERISDVTIPPESSFKESEKTEQMSIRLSKYENQLDFITNYYQFSIEFLTLGKIKKLIALIKYLRWDQMSESSTSLNTRFLAELITKIKQGSDKLSSGIVSDAQKHLEELAKKISNKLRELIFYHRENYKLEIRKKIIPEIDYNSNHALQQQDEVVKKAKRVFQTAMPNQSFYPDLIKEILNEEYSIEKDSLRKNVLNRLQVKKTEKPKEEKQAIDFKSYLMEGFKVLASCSYQLMDANTKLKENSDLIQNRKRSFSEYVMRWLRKMVQGEKTAILYDIEFFDVSTSTSKQERLNFTQFQETVENKSKYLYGLTSAKGMGLKRLEGMEDDDLFTSLNKHIEDVQLIYRRMGALETFFKTEVPREERSRVRGIKIELNAIKNSIVKANKKKHEYVAKKEEIEQMKKLGISPGSM